MFDLVIVVNIYIRASSWNFGTYHICIKQRLRRACASMLSRHSLHCSQIVGREVDESVDQISGLKPYHAAVHSYLDSDFANI